MQVNIPERAAASADERWLMVTKNSNSV